MGTLSATAAAAVSVVGPVTPENGRRLLKATICPRERRGGVNRRHDCSRYSANNAETVETTQNYLRPRTFFILPDDAILPDPPILCYYLNNFVFSKTLFFFCTLFELNNPYKACIIRLSVDNGVYGQKTC